MASPVKAFIDPSGLYLIMNPTPCLYTDKKFLITGTNTIAWPVQIEETVSRFSLSIPMMIMNSILCTSAKPNTKEGKVITTSTFSSIYQERGASTTRPTEGQLYPLGI
jgi:hypothetical protein